MHPNPAFRREDAARVRQVVAFGPGQRRVGRMVVIEPALHQSVAQHVARRVEPDRQIPERRERGPGRLIEQQVIALDDRHVAFGLDHGSAGDGQVAAPVEQRIDNLATVLQPPDEMNEAIGIKGFRRAFAWQQAAGGENLVVEVKAVHRDGARAAAGLVDRRRHIGGKDGFAPGRRAGNGDQPAAGLFRQASDALRQIGNLALGKGVGRDHLRRPLVRPRPPGDDSGIM